MAHAKFSVSWEEHSSNISNGLSTLQQNNEFVDMTLAADGHFVKVHQLIMALSSPYIKDLIASAQCPHPVIFLNKISYSTLSTILEYIYTGEVMISIENLSDLLEAAKELHIKGLEDMDITKLLSGNIKRNKNKIPLQEHSHSELETFHEITTECEDKMEETNDTDVIDYKTLEDGMDQSFEHDGKAFFISEEKAQEESAAPRSSLSDVNTLQYTVSNQGSLQMILNRFVYYLKYTNRDRFRQWRCVDYLNTKKCPAYVVTKDDVVVQRTLAHSHPFHDKRILKHLKSGSIYTALHEAENNDKKKKRKNNESAE